MEMVLYRLYLSELVPRGEHISKYFMKMTWSVYFPDTLGSKTSFGQIPEASKLSGSL